MKVDKTWKGEKVEEITMSTGAKKYGDRIVRESCDFLFKAGEKYLIYGRKNGDKLVTHKCTGSGLIEHSTERLAFLNALAKTMNKK